MTHSIEHDRHAQLLLGTGEDLSFDEARRRLESAAMVLTADDAARTPWGQAALLSIAACGTRIFRGGVFVRGDLDTPTIVGSWPGFPLRRLLKESGCRFENIPSHACELHIGATRSTTPDTLYCWASGWSAWVSARPSENTDVPGNELSGVLAGAMGVSEVFRRVVLNDIRAGKKTLTLSALAPGLDATADTQLDFLPEDLWLIGLGNLGQATLWTLGMLPYRDTGSVHLMLQDGDISGLENMETQVLTQPGWVGNVKARMTAQWAEQRGFRTKICERRFAADTRPQQGEPRLALVGVDNVETRRLAAHADFDLILDAGLGATSPEIFDLRLHGFPGRRDAAAAWPAVANAASVAPGREHQKLINDGRLSICGSAEIAGRQVATPFTAMAAAAIQVAQACRAISTGEYCDLIDVTLSDTQNAFSSSVSIPRQGMLRFQDSRR